MTDDHERTPWAVRGLFLAAILVAAGYATAFSAGSFKTAGPWLLAMGNALLVPSAMALGAPLTGPRGRLVKGALVATGIVLLAAVGAALLVTEPEHAASPLWLGFPRRAAIVLVGVGVAPMIVLPALFAWTFDASALAPDRIEAIRALRPSDVPDAS